MIRGVESIVLAVSWIYHVWCMHARIIKCLIIVELSGVFIIDRKAEFCGLLIDFLPLYLGKVIQSIYCTLIIISFSPDVYISIYIICNLTFQETNKCMHVLFQSSGKELVNNLRNANSVQRKYCDFSVFIYIIN